MRATLTLPQPVWDTAEAGRRAGAVADTRGHTDLSLPQHLLQAKAAYDDQMYNRLMEYGAQLQVLGVLAGVFDTTLDGIPAETLRREVAAAVAKYSVSLTERSKREHWYEGLGFLDISASSLGYLMQGGGWVASQLGGDETGAGMSKMGQTLRETDPHKLIYNVASDYISGLIDSAKARWDEFWTDVETKGYLIATARIKADADFLGAEIALDIAMGAVSGGVATGIKIVAKRLAGEVTEIAIRVTTKVARAVPDAHVAKVLRVADADIDAKITREILDEDKLGTGSHSDDLARRGEQPDPAKEKPDGDSRAAGARAPETTKVTRGGNEETITYDPQTGRPISSEGTIRQDYGSTPRKDNATAVGKLGNTEGDHGGHLAAHRFFGDTPDEGIAPMAGNLNTGAWKTMENEWADWTRLGYEVDYKVDVYPPGSVRPDAFKSTYVVRNPKTGEIVYKNKEAFENKPGQTFERVTWRDMQNSYGDAK